MKDFRIMLRDITQNECIESVASFVGEDSSGSFGIMAGHARMMTSLESGLAHFRLLDGDWQFVAMSDAMLYFAGNELVLNTGRYIRSDNYEDIGQKLLDTLAEEERNLSEIKQNLHRIEENFMHYMLKIEKDQTYPL